MSISLILLLLQSAQPDAEDIAQCEAHFFPTKEIQGFTRLGNYGLLSDLTEGDPVPTEAMLAAIKADTQFEIASKLFDQAARLEGFRFVEHKEAIDAKTSFKQRTRLTQSDHACYVEIVVNYISFSDSVLSKAKVGVHFVTRDFRKRPEKPKIRKLGGAALLKPDVDEQDIDFESAYREAFEAAIARFWKG